MSNIEWIGLSGSATLLSLLLGLLMLLVRDKYIHIEVHADESDTYEVEAHGCVSLLATVLGVLCFTIGVASFVALLFITVVFVIIPYLDNMISALAVAYGIVEVFSLVLLCVLFVLSFFKDLLNPPR